MHGKRRLVKGREKEGNELGDGCGDDSHAYNNDDVDVGGDVGDDVGDDDVVDDDDDDYHYGSR